MGIGQSSSGGKAFFQHSPSEGEIRRLVKEEKSGEWKWVSTGRNAGSTTVTFQCFDCVFPGLMHCEKKHMMYRPAPPKPAFIVANQDLTVSATNNADDLQSAITHSFERIKPLKIPDHYLHKSVRRHHLVYIRHNWIWLRSRNPEIAKTRIFVVPPETIRRCVIKTKGVLVDAPFEYSFWLVDLLNVAATKPADEHSLIPKQEQDCVVVLQQNHEGGFASGTRVELWDAEWFR